MKRSLKRENSNDGKFLKKIKILSFQLNNDDKVEDPSNSEPIFKDMTISKDDDSDLSSDSEVESVHSPSQNEELNEEYRAILEKYNNSDIAEDIVNGMKTARSEVASNLEMDDLEVIDINNIEGYIDNQKNIIEIMSKLKQGKFLPKFVKVLPQIKDWTYIIDQLNVPSWSPAAMKMMADKFRAKGGDDAEMFYRSYLLPYVRENITKNQRLDDVLFQALREALYRRREFMRGLLLPWCKDNIEGKEAEVLSNVIKNTTVKPDTGLLAMHMIIQKMDYSKGRLLVLRSFIEKKYALPILLIAELTEYFYKIAVSTCEQFLTEKGQMPLVWFQTLNLFVSFNYMYLTDEDLKKLLNVCRIQKHDKVTPAITAYLKMRSTSTMETQ